MATSSTLTAATATAIGSSTASRASLSSRNRAASDLGAEPALTELRTGDLGRQRDDGLLQVVGRTSRFAKLLGQRIDLDRVQSTLSAFDPTLVCLSDDEQLLVAVTNADPRLVRSVAVG